MQKYVKMEELKYILDSTKGTTKMVIKGIQSEEGYLVDDDFAVYVYTDWIDKTVNAKEVVEQFKKCLEDKKGKPANVFHINNRVK